MLNNNNIPNEVVYKKLRDYPDNEKIEICDCGINEGQRYGDIPYFKTKDGDYLQLPSRYADYIIDILGSEEDYLELKAGKTIIKSSRETKNGSITPTFTYLD